MDRRVFLGQKKETSSFMRERKKERIILRTDGFLMGLRESIPNSPIVHC